jgi:hypothetical protein
VIELVEIAVGYGAGLDVLDHRKGLDRRIPGD